MDPTNMLELSFYEEIKPINNKKNVFLVSHVETGILYVKKIYTSYKLEVFNRINALNIPGIPKSKLIVEDPATQTLTLIEEHINGVNLENYLSLKDAPLASVQAAEIIDKICNILQKLHNEMPPIIHRDIKPSNILITPDNEIYIVDFNISRALTDSDTDTTILGTQGYAAPEQYGFMQCTQQTDIYSLGVLLKFLLTKSPALPQKYQGLLAPVIRKATAMDPNDRYKTVSDFNQAIQNLVNHVESKDVKEETPLPKPDVDPLPKSTPKINSAPKIDNFQFKMSMLAKICFTIAVLVVFFSFFEFSMINGSSIIESILYLLSYVHILVFPFFSFYYVYKKKLRLVKNPILNIILHFMLILLITAVIFLVLLILMVAVDSII